jgi:hypothetical protein
VRGEQHHVCADRCAADGHERTQDAGRRGSNEDCRDADRQSDTEPEREIGRLFGEVDANTAAVADTGDRASRASAASPDVR